MKNLEEIAKESESTEEALAALHDAQATPAHAIKALRDGRGLSLHDAKIKLVESPKWSKEAGAAGRLHEQLDELINKGGCD